MNFMSFDDIMFSDYRPLRIELCLTFLTIIFVWYHIYILIYFNHIIDFFKVSKFVSGKI